MAPQKRVNKMRDAGVNPTMQRLAILEYLEGTKAHPTADEIYSAVHERFPTIARATVYNTLEALSTAGTILKLTVDPAAARYDADTGPHVHFRCRVCGRVYDIDARENRCLGHEVDGHEVESVHTYAFGVCSSCRDTESEPARTPRRRRQGTRADVPAGRLPGNPPKTKRKEGRHARTA